jgi:hypothetical protein
MCTKSCLANTVDFVVSGIGCTTPRLLDIVSEASITLHNVLLLEGLVLMNVS